MRRWPLMMVSACLSFSIGCGNGKNAALQASEVIAPQPNGTHWVSKAGLAEWQQDCGFVASPADDPVLQTDDPSIVAVTDGYLTKLMLACAR